MSRADARIMFEIYGETADAPHYRVVYFTELEEHERECEISRAMAGNHVFDGFIPEDDPAAKQRIDTLLQKLNAGENPDPECIAAELGGVLI